MCGMSLRQSVWGGCHAVCGLALFGPWVALEAEPAMCSMTLLALRTPYMQTNGRLDLEHRGTKAE